MATLSSKVKRGPATGTVLYPHKHKDGCFVVSRTRFKRDYIRIANETELESWVARGLSLRMSCPGRAASLIAPGSIVRKA